MNRSTSLNRQAALLIMSGSNDRAIYAVCRVARRLGVEFHIIANGPADHILWGRYRRRVCHVRSDCTLDARRLSEWAACARRRSAIPDIPLVLLPSSEFLNRFLLAQERVGVLRSLGMRLPLADAGLYVRVSDKESASSWAQAVGLRVPQRLPDFAPLHLPLVAKPRSNIGLQKQVLYPLLINNEVQLQAFLAQGNQDAYFPQEMVNGGSRYLLGYISRDGREWLHAQRNLAQQPGGKSIVLACGDDLHQSAVGRTVVDGLKALGFFGLFMVEFKGGATDPCFIEINPRPWGPLQLCVDAGSGIVEAFLGDWLCNNPDQFLPSPVGLKVSSYLWCGGFFEVWRAGGSIDWQGCRNPWHWLQVLRTLPKDVYLRVDSWHVFWRELRGIAH